MSWVQLYTRLAIANILLCLGEWHDQSVNPLIGGLLHYSELRLGVENGFVAIHTTGGTAYAVSSLVDALGWLKSAPVGCVVGAISTIGLIFKLQGRFGLEHCRVRLHSREATVSGPTTEICAFAMATGLARRSPLLAPTEMRRYLSARECLALSILDGTAHHQAVEPR